VPADPSGAARLPAPLALGGCNGRARADAPPAGRCGRDGRARVPWAAQVTTVRRMPTSAETSSTQLLVQFLTAVSSCPDSATAARVAAGRVAAAFDAEVGAVILPGRVEAAVGIPEDLASTDALLAVAHRETEEIEVPGVGVCAALAAPLREATDGHLVVARSYISEFSTAEVHLLRGMARAFHVALLSLRTVETERAMRALSDRQAAENRRLLESLRVRHQLLERLVGVQRAITRRAPLDEVLGTVVDGARGLLGDDVAVICLVDRDDPDRFVHVTSRGMPAAVEAAVRRSRPSPTDPTWAAITTDRVVLARGPVLGSDVDAWPGERPATALAAPVHEGSRPAGALVVASSAPDRAYGTEDQAVLEAFAEQVSLALTDALTLAEMDRANHDAVTGLASRRLFMQRLDEALGASPGPLVAVLFIDLDRFKMVNDTLGHAAGDALLMEVGARIRGALRGRDSAARFGGDEFAVLIEAVDDVEGVVAIADRIGAAIRESVAIAGRDVFVDASIGIVTAPPGSTDGESLVRDADVAMYEAKQTGAGRSVVFDTSMRERFERRVELEHDLRTALTHDEFCLHYQPIVDLVTEDVVCVEALLRWDRPGHGWVPPLSFIPVAEETGVILPIGDWVLREACRQARVWHDALPPGRAPAVAVNLSARQIAEPGLAARVAAALADSGLPPDGLVLEITESILMKDRDLAMSRLGELKALGVGLAVDDFGTGYSSLTYLRGFPVDILKIDKAFVDDVADDAEAAQLARAIVELGRTLHLSTVAEGIERPEQCAVMRDSACALGQGYLFSRPVDAAALWEMLRSTVGAPR